MNYFLKAFGNLKEFEASSFDSVPPIGVLSAEASSFNTKTFTFNENAYVDASITQLLHSNQDEIESILTIPFQSAMVKIANEVANFNDSTPVADQLASTCPEISDAIVEGSTAAGVHHIPEYVFGKITIGDDTLSFHLWFSDARLQLEYTDWKIKVVQPLANIDLLFGTFASVKSLIDGMKYNDMIVKINAATGNEPSTLNAVEEIEWVDPTNPNVKISIPWTIIGYGPNASYRQNILKSIREHLEAPETASTHTLEEWIGLLPGLINEDKFLFIPQWDKPAKKILGQPVPFYNPTMLIGKAETMLSTCIPDSEGNVLADKVALSAITMHYPSCLSGVMLGDLDNEDSRRNFADAFFDYSLFSSNNFAINDVRPETAALYRKLEDLIDLAVNYKPTDVLTGDITASSIGVVNALSAVVGSTIISVVTRESYVLLIGV